MVTPYEEEFLKALDDCYLDPILANASDYRTCIEKHIDKVAELYCQDNEFLLVGNEPYWLVQLFDHNNVRYLDRLVKDTSVGVSGPTSQLPAGVYWIGDPSYVSDELFEQCLHDFQGVNTTKSGYLYAIYNTNGDGIFIDSDGDEYGVDVANIGCIPLDAIDEESDLGHLVRFSEPFVCQYINNGGFICFGDLTIKTDLFSKLRNPKSEISTSATTEDNNSNVLMHMKLRPEGLGLSDLVLLDDDKVDSNTQLVMKEIAYYINEEDKECGDALLTYDEFDDDDRELIIWKFYLVFHSNKDHFTEYFRGYYATPDNQLHEMNIESGNTSIELYEFLNTLDWSEIFTICRRHCNTEIISSLFSAWTGYDYEEERARYPVQQWDGNPEWEMKDGKYLASA